jgi:hypothetical protein
MTTYRRQIARSFVPLLPRLRPLRGLDEAILLGFLRATGAVEGRHGTGRRASAVDVSARWLPRRPATAGDVPSATRPRKPASRPAAAFGSRVTTLPARPSEAPSGAAVPSSRRYVCRHAGRQRDRARRRPGSHAQFFTPPIRRDGGSTCRPDHDQRSGPAAARHGAPGAADQPSSSSWLGRKCRALAHS